MSFSPAPSRALAAVAVEISADAASAKSLAEQARDIDPSLSSPSDSIYSPRSLAHIAKAFAAIGDFADAETIAHSITNPFHQIAALADIAELAHGAGDIDHARELVKTAEAVALTLRLPDGPPVRGVARATASVGLHTHAEALAQLLSGHDAQGEAMAGIAEAMTIADLARAEANAVSIMEPYWQARALAGIAWAAAEYHPEAARRAAEGAESVARAIVDHDVYGRMIGRVVIALATAGDRGRAIGLARRAERLALSASDSSIQAEALAGAAHAMAAAGDLECAQSLVDSIGQRSWRAQALAEIARTAFHDGNPTSAQMFVEQAQTVARSITAQHQRELALAGVGRALATIGDIAQAEKILLSLAHSALRDQVKSTLVPAVWVSAREEHAEVLLRSIKDPEWAAWTLTELAVAVAAIGDYERARAFAEEAASMAQLLDDPREQALIMARVAYAIVSSGDATQAEAIARSITDPNAKAQALATAATRSSTVHAARLLGEALQIGDLDFVVTELAFSQPSAVSALADDLMKVIDRRALLSSPPESSA